MVEKVFFAIIGCGRISEEHAKAILENTQTELECVFDIKPEKAENLAKKTGATAAKSAEEIFENKKVDVVSICTPNGTHFEIAKKALESGKNVLIEKPICLSMAEVEELEKISKKFGKKIFCVMQVRYNPAVQELKKAVEKGKLGRIRIACLSVKWHRPKEYFSESDWKGTKKLDGGTLINQGIHYIDILQWLVGKPKKILAKTSNQKHSIEVEDTAMAIIEFENNCVATVDFNVATEPDNWECTISIIGEKGRAKIGGKALNEIVEWKINGEKPPELKKTENPKSYNNGQYHGSCPNHAIVYENVVSELLEVTAKAMKISDAKNSLKLVLDIYRAAKEKKEIQV